MWKKIIYNIVLSIILLELSSFLILFWPIRKSVFDQIKSGYNILQILPITKPFSEKNYDKNYRTPLNKSEKDSGSIIIFGCSFGYGLALDDNENFSGQLAKLTKKTIFNRSERGFGAQMMLYQLQTKRVLEKTKDCKYIIYVYIPDHVRRTVLYRCFPFLYKVSVRYMLDRKENLKLQIPNPILVNSNLYRLYESYLPKIYGDDYCIKVLYKIIKESYLLSKQFYKDCKFIVLDYSEYAFPLKEEVEKLGIKVISIPNLTNGINLFQEYYQIAKDDGHPNAKAWELITPLFIKEAEIK